ncbi:hypothetical protein QBC33DRAFT_573949 [Phialemonium atrogriseum]|uniref:Uncharacterized protein n=1 Tax=Phialemonium atrogriseum TaxID=1093897 RepID=A0AAJ0BRT5_9PEZI|nr:uncharacterized protein QBC33DRAFT_573949 [Phialemonium atrogriseum]KAK1762872.1 hypothetical protein QBC33DRAFT_573949 [Phialemonium atrogriseum]
MNAANNYLRISKISRTFNDDSAQLIRVGFGTESRTLIDPELYEIEKPQPQNGDESNRPAAFKLVRNAGKSYHLVLHFAGSFCFLNGTLAYRLVGTSPGNLRIATDQFLHEGDGYTVQEFDTANMGLAMNTFSSQLQDGEIDSPFRASGDWIWELYCFGGHEAVGTSHPVRMELYFFLGNTAMHDAKKDHCLELIRRTIPPYSLIQGKTWPVVEADVVRHLAWNLWNLGSIHGIEYDTSTSGGGSTYLVDKNVSISSFLGDHFHAFVNPCNCWDLAALVWAGCLSLGCRPGPHDQKEIRISETFVISGRPWGYVPHGPLFGWQEHASRHCNSPFWFDWESYSNDEASHRWDVPWDDADRTGFSAHCFAVLVPANGHGQKVLDICHGTTLQQQPVFNYALEVGCTDLGVYLENAREIGSIYQTKPAVFLQNEGADGWTTVG